MQSATPESSVNPTGTRLQWSDIADSILADVRNNAQNAPALDNCDAREISNRIELADSSQKFVLGQGRSQPLAILKIANEITPDSIAVATRTASDICTAIRDINSTAANHVLQPLATGSIEGRSYGLYSWLEPLAATQPAWLIQRTRLMPRVFAWAEQVTRATVRDATDEEVQTMHLAPLASIVDDPSELGPEFQSVARKTMERIESGKVRLKTVAMHGDPWKNNILIDQKNVSGFPPGSALSRFMFIDWSTAMRNGYPFFDIVRLGNTFRSRPNQILRALNTHCELTECDTTDVPGYIAAALGNVRQNLENCPRHVLALSAQKYLADLHGYHIL